MLVLFRPRADAFEPGPTSGTSGVTRPTLMIGYEARVRCDELTRIVEVQTHPPAEDRDPAVDLVEDQVACGRAVGPFAKRLELDAGGVDPERLSVSKEKELALFRHRRPVADDHCRAENVRGGPTR